MKFHYYYLNNFDWNSKQEEFYDNPKGFREWLNYNKKEEFIKNLDKLIQKTRQDLIVLIKKIIKKTKKQAQNMLYILIPNRNPLQIKLV